MCLLPLVLSGFLMLNACGPMEGDPQRPSAEAKSDFLMEYAERTGTVGRGYLKLHDDGTLTYEELQNNHCLFEYSGKVDIVEMPDANTYSITYRYTALNTAHRSCLPSDPNCQSDFEACQRAVTKANSELGKMKNQKIARGSPPSSVRLLP